jgi:hypothetical protein
MHARNKREAFPLKCRSPSGDGHHWPKYVKDILCYKKRALLHLMVYIVYKIHYVTQYEDTVHLSLR